MSYQPFCYISPTEYCFSDDYLESLRQKLQHYKPRKLFVLASARGFSLVSGLLEEMEQSYYWKSGCMANPTAQFVDACAEELGKNGCDFLLGIGGGSTIDAMKATALLAANPEAGGCWNLIDGTYQPEHPALPMGVVVTIPSTGSEANSSCVISSWECQEKSIYTQDSLYPVFAITSPSLTYTLPPHQTAAGAADILSHLLETYLHGDKGVELSDNLLLGAMAAVVKWAPVCLRDPENYDGRANLLWASYLAMNRTFGVGHSENWICHMVEHTLSAKYDLTHGVGMAMILPAYIRTLRGDAIEHRLSRLSREVFDGEGEPAWKLLREFFDRLCLPCTLSEANLRPSQQELQECAEKSTAWGPVTVNGLSPFAQQDAYTLLQSIC